MPPQTIMDHVESIITHTRIVDDKVTAVEARVDIVEASANSSARVGVASEVQINEWIGLFGDTFDGLVQKAINVISGLVFPRLTPLESFFASVGSSGVSTQSSLQLTPPGVGDNLLSRIAALERASAAGGSSTCPTQHTANMSSFAPLFSFPPPYGGGQPPFSQQQSMAPAPAGAAALTLQVADLEVKLIALQLEVTLLKKMSDDTLIKVQFIEFKSAVGFAGWWKLNCVVTNAIGQPIANDVNLCFADALGLLAMAAGTRDCTSTDLEDMNFAYKAHQIGYLNTEAALLYQSIDKQLPVMINKLKSTTSEWILLLCSTFPSWDNQNGETSFVKIRKRELQNCFDHLMYKTEDQLSGVARTVASTLLADAHKFCLALFKFMTNTVVVANFSRVGEGQKSEIETWKFVTHAVRAIFDHLYEIRRKALLYKTDPAAMVWHFMKTREEQNKILRIGIKDFHIVTNIFHVHMKPNADMQAEFDDKMDAMQKTVAEAGRKAEAARVKADQVKNVVDANC